MAGSKFHAFPRLPSEIQIMIWESACTVERIVPILPGLGHLSPITHQTLRVPPILHVCTNSREIGLRHYNLSFHPRLYINRDYDQLMLHIFSPFKTIDCSLYKLPEASFNWEKAPRRLAVFLDDASFHQSRHEGLSWANYSPTSGPSFRPFSDEFMWSVDSYPGNFKGPVRISELTLLVLPPLTVRPNPMAHRLDLASGPVLNSMSSFLNAELRTRAEEAGDPPPPMPRVILRHALLSPFPTPFPKPCHSPAHYADLKYGTKLTPDDIANPSPAFTLLRPPAGIPIRHYRLLPKQYRMSAIQRDIDLLSHPFSHGDRVGLGPYIVWNRESYRCGNGARTAALAFHYRGIPRLFWMSAEEEERRVKCDQFRAWQRVMRDRGELGEKEGAGDSGDEEGYEYLTGPRWDTLRFNGLYFWGLPEARRSD
ncbi:hypothetical protein B0T14DRAFT_565801 [Immersiella caudata]|uniref:2EXR domain-containing protein n=1 Tax=Immersiella caudata TaxID=314043 RepID=A0AA39WNY0_9PEZI|nr:hypothetical protein B0T14DRAFT_565801 [Immersiella caudata]